MLNATQRLHRFGGSEKDIARGIVLYPLRAETGRSTLDKDDLKW